MLGLNVGRKIGSVGGRSRDRVVDRTDVLLQPLGWCIFCLVSVAVPYDACKTFT